MSSHTITLEDADYKYLERAASVAGLSIPTFLRQLITRERAHAGKTRGGRWAKMSERVRRDPPLSGVGDYVHECSRTLRDEFVLTPDDMESS